ncbi:MAG TPA: CRISPR-associated endonuclease Cas3'' [Acidobacteriota bacterium]|nr:CRISPR-associated endonuclease Cas3'' [Acidobacteriota bacterium]
MVAPLASCWARPPAAGRSHLLLDHLKRVAVTCGDPGGDIGQRLAFLAGFLHDAGKSHEHWQAYIRGQRRKGPPHAPLGSALFCFCAHKLLPKWCPDKQKLDSYVDSLLEWVVSVHSHHGRLADLDVDLPPWDASHAPVELKGLGEGCPLQEVFGQISAYWNDLEVSDGEFLGWLDSFPEVWERWVGVLRPRRVRRSQALSVDLALRLPNVSARLIWADRSEAGAYGESQLAQESAEAGCRHLADYCRARGRTARARGASSLLVESRAKLQRSALKRYRQSPESPLYTLQVATGYGKTLTALRVALEACRRGRCRRIVYAAPYISILSQAAREITGACGIPVLEHHHLALLEQFDPNKAEEAVARADDQDFEALDTWRAPVVATTFNQLFRALFPRRAQHTLRLSALDQAFIIVDEPQIIDTGIWNVFLSSLQALCAARGSQALLVTATLPPLFAGLEREPEKLAPPLPAQTRFRIESSGQALTPAALADGVPGEVDEAGSVAVVVNTVRDAAEIYGHLREVFDQGRSLFCLTALMLPWHKAQVIDRIASALEKKRPLAAVCTQVLEAGVDLSFRRIVRARPIFPCIAQVAGRANRHGEEEVAVVRVFPLIREEGRDVWDLVYRDVTARRQTELLLSEKPVLSELALTDALRAYFGRCWAENAQTQQLERFDRAAHGEWSALAGLEPFGPDYPKTSVFVPLERESMSPQVQALLGKWAPRGCGQLLDLAADQKFRSTLSFRERKQFSLLIRQFCVPVPESVARRVAEPFNDWLWQISDPADYSRETGLAHCLLDAEDEAATQFV